MRDVVLAEMTRQALNDAVVEITAAEKISRARQLDRIMIRLKEMAYGNFAVNMATGVVGRANEQNKRTIESSLKQAFGIDMRGLMGNSVVKDTLELAVRNNVNLITSIHTDFMSEIGDVIRESVMEGKRHTDMISMIRERGNVSESRARLIARDQTAKINSDLTRERHQSMGISMYFWGGAGDERERTSHRLLNGKLCRYDDPTVYSDDGGKTWKSRRSLTAYDPATKKNVHAFIGHPGDDIQCRCFQRPHVIIDLDEAA